MAPQGATAMHVVIDLRQLLSKQALALLREGSIYALVGIVHDGRQL